MALTQGGLILVYDIDSEENLLNLSDCEGMSRLPYRKCCRCYILDMVQPEAKNMISLRDLKSCRMTAMFFDTLFNLEKYLDHEQRDPFTSQRTDDEESMMSDWDRYAAEEYEFLVAEEGGGDQPDDMWFSKLSDVSAIYSRLDTGTDIQNYAYKSDTQIHCKGCMVKRKLGILILWMEITMMRMKK
ncbi:unnamed protein product, partial [Meganyctiphanes norvegica]